jgi:BirA family biotin operon repressor/biotin-[acetyl-CoA-carboxylase] ligase
MPIRDNSMLSWLSLSVAWHLVAVLQSRGVKALSVKWPNDIYLDGQKLAGILVELVGNLENGFEAVIGVGMNVHNLVDQRIDQSYSSLSLHGLELDKTSLLADIVRAFYQKLWLNFEQPSAEQWQQIDYLSEKSVELVVGDRRIQGQARGVNEEGQLLIEIDGQLNSFNGGEVSVRAKQ